MLASEIIEYHKKVISDLDKKKKKGLITKEEYEERKARQEANTRAKVKEYCNAGVTIEELMKPR